MSRDTYAAQGVAVAVRAEQFSESAATVHVNEAMLAGAIAAASMLVPVADFFGLIDYRAIGVSRKEMEGWWESYTARTISDMERKKSDALAKLTDEEKRLLNLGG